MSSFQRMLRVKSLEVSLSLPSWTTRWDLQRYRRFDHVLGETTGNSRALANNMIPLLKDLQIGLARSPTLPADQPQPNIGTLFICMSP